MKTLKLLSFCMFGLCFTSGLFCQDEIMDYTELQEYLPKNIPGYEAGEPDGSSMSMQGMSFSSAEVEFTKPDGSWIRINILDYSAAFNMYQAATAMWAAGMSFEDSDTRAKSVQWSEKIVGWEEFRKNKNEAYLALGIGDRFFLTIEANKQSDVSFVNEIGKKMDLDNLPVK